MNSLLKYSLQDSLHSYRQENFQFLKFVIYEIILFFGFLREDYNCYISIVSVYFCNLLLYNWWRNCLTCQRIN